MSVEKNTGGRKKDYIAHLAIILLALIIFLEILLVSWLPSRLITESIWEREVALTELIDLEDMLRKRIKHSIKFRNKWEAGEAHIALDSLDQIARYLRKNNENMTRDQIRTLYEVLKRVEERYNQWINYKYCISFEKIDVKPLLQGEFDKYSRDIGYEQGKDKTDSVHFQD